MRIELVRKGTRKVYDAGKGIVSVAGYMALVLYAGNPVRSYSVSVTGASLSMRWNRVTFWFSPLRWTRWYVHRTGSAWVRQVGPVGIVRL